MSEHEPLDELRALYARLRPAEPADDAADGDPVTARSVDWMRAAWARVEAPAPPRLVPRPVPARTRLPRRRLALAAGLLALLGASLFLRAPDKPDARREGLVAQVPAESFPTNQVEGVPDPAVEVIDVRNEQVELRSGPVRLLLLAPPEETTPERTEEPSKTDRETQK